MWRSSRQEFCIIEIKNHRRIAVVGASGGIGEGIATSLREGGAKVYGLDLKASGKEPVVDSLPIDVTREESVASVVAEMYHGDPAPIDLVNCAGIVENDTPAEVMPMETYDRVMGVNLRGVYLTCMYFGRELLHRGGGSIVNVASMSGNQVVNVPQRQSVYNTSKAGVSALTRSLAVEWGGRGVRVNAVSPGYVDTAMNAMDQHLHEEWVDRTIVGRMAHIEEIASAVEFLLSDGAAYCQGVDLLIDGGYSLR